MTLQSKKSISNRIDGSIGLKM